MEEILARAVQVFLALAGGYLVVLWFALVVWTYRDIGSRSQSVVTQIFATLLSLLFFIPGSLLYLLMRPRATLDESFQRSLEEEYLLQDIEEASLCPSCQRQVSDDYILCPSCQTSLKLPCTSCNQLIKIGWPVCPYCGSDQSDLAISIRERVEPPADRYLERGSRTFRQVAGPTVREVPAPEHALELGYQAELAAMVEEPEPAAEPHQEEAAPIKLFDRKRTRAKKQKATSTSNGVSAADLNMEKQGTLDDGVVEDTAVIAEFVANGANGNGNGSHVVDSVDVIADSVENANGDGDVDEVDVAAKSTSAR